MKYCAECGRVLANHAVFCSACGSRKITMEKPVMYKKNIDAHSQNQQVKTDRCPEGKPQRVPRLQEEPLTGHETIAMAHWKQDNI
ncbi:MAG: zinc-ribbon domain-containing protein [Clostridia bacterium]|nr:zinc-ribbon domain-containing protein [Clostridia bacterium]NCC44281.1 zinc-ribbon domain-containing protein [Clostridia bacterium]